MVQIVLEEGLGLLLIRINESPSDLFFQELEVLLVQGVLEKLQIYFAAVVGQIRVLHHVDQRLPDIDGVDAVACCVVRKGVVERLHDETGRDARHALALGRFAEFLNIDLFGPSLFNDLFPVVELDFRH